jgi:ribose 5-phosphate isomerase B
MRKTIYLGADHAGYALKEKLKSALKKKKITFEDLGNLDYSPSDDYPDFAAKVAAAAVKHKSLGILICGSAQGMCIAANKIRGARAVIPLSEKEARLSREHNDANILCLSGWFSSQEKAISLVDIFLSSSFSRSPRHLRRLEKINRLEKNNKR